MPPRLHCETCGHITSSLESAFFSSVVHPVNDGGRHPARRVLRSDGLQSVHTFPRPLMYDWYQKRLILHMQLVAVGCQMVSRKNPALQDEASVDKLLKSIQP